MNIQIKVCSSLQIIFKLNQNTISTFFYLRQKEGLYYLPLLILEREEFIDFEAEALDELDDLTTLGFETEFLLELRLDAFLSSVGAEFRLLVPMLLFLLLFMFMLLYDTRFEVFL